MGGHARISRLESRAQVDEQLSNVSGHPVQRDMDAPRTYRFDEKGQRWPIALLDLAEVDVDVGPGSGVRQRRADLPRVFKVEGRADLDVQLPRIRAWLDGNAHVVTPLRKPKIETTRVEGRRRESWRPRLAGDRA